MNFVTRIAHRLHVLCSLQISFCLLIIDIDVSGITDNNALNPPTHQNGQ